MTATDCAKLIAYLNLIALKLKSDIRIKFDDEYRAFWLFNTRTGLPVEGLEMDNWWMPRAPHYVYRWALRYIRANAYFVALNQLGLRNPKLSTSTAGAFCGGYFVNSSN